MNISDYRRKRMELEPVETEEEELSPQEAFPGCESPPPPAGGFLNGFFGRSRRPKSRGRRPAFLDGEMIFLIILVGGAFIALSVMAYLAGTH